MKYLWTENVDFPSFPALDCNLSTDVLVVGGGMAGVLCAHFLQQRGVDCVLAEAKQIGGGITSGTTAVLSAQHDTLYTDFIRQFGIQKAQQYLSANLLAVQQFRRLAQTLSCDFADKPSLLYSRTDRQKMQQEVQNVRLLGFPAEFLSSTPLPFAVAGAVKYPGMAQFHPLKFLSEIARGLKIYENTNICKIEDGIAYTASWQIKARKIIIATHFPFLNRRGLYFMKLYQKRSFVLALQNAPDFGATFVDHAQNGMYFRNYGDLLLLGGGDHRTGADGGGFEAVRQFAKKYFPQASERYAWATQDCMTLDGAPYIGCYSPATPNLYVATGFNEWGMTSSMVAASLLTDAVTGVKNPFSPVFAPERSMLRTQLFANIGTTLLDFLTPSPKRCSHLGCALKWNPAERSWDCPCHGSRFDEHGKLLENPATKDSRVE